MYYPKNLIYFLLANSTIAEKERDDIKLYNMARYFYITRIKLLSITSHDMDISRKKILQVKNWRKTRGINLDNVKLSSFPMA